MRLTTVVWAKFESKGKPDATHVMEGQLGFIAKSFVGWLCDHAMGHYIRVTIARTEHELEKWSGERAAGRTDSEKLLGDFNDALAELGFSAATPPAPAEYTCARCGLDTNLCTCQPDEG